MEDVCKKTLLQEGLVLGPQIGRGSFGTVFRCTDIKTQVSYAVKIVDLRKLRMQPHFVMDRLRRECSVLEDLNHPSIVRLYRTVDGNDAMFMIMEMVLGMELFEMIVAVAGLEESEAAAVFIQIASSLAYMHSKGIVHRDIKPENILVQGALDDDSNRKISKEDSMRHFKALKPRVKLIDFGLSKVLGTDKGGSVAKSLVGTPRYVAPEIVEVGERMQAADRSLVGPSLAGLSYTEKVDCYSSGVLLHVMVSACFPQFNHEKHVIYKDKRINKCTDDVKRLVSALMQPDPKKRMTMREALDDPWVRKHHPEAAAEAAAMADGVLKRSVQKKKGKSVSKMNYEDFERRVLNGEAISDMMLTREDGNTLSEGESMESIMVDQDFMQSHKNVVRDDKMTGVKRQVSQSAARGPSGAISPSAVHSLSDSEVSPGGRERIRSVSSGRSASKSSIEVLNLPGAACKGVWGPFSENRSGSNESSSTSGGGVFESFQETNDEIRRDLKENDTVIENIDQVEDLPAHIIPSKNIIVDNDPLSNKFQTPDGIVNPDLLLQLQSKIAECFQQAFKAFKSDDIVSPGIVSSAVGSRELLRASETILKKLEQTSLSVHELIPDMTLAVEEGEFGMAALCFDQIKTWIHGIQTESQDLLKANVKVIAAVNSTLQLARRRYRVRTATAAGHRVTDAVAKEKTFDSFMSNLSTGTGTSGGAVEAAEAGHRAASDALKMQEQADILEEQEGEKSRATTPKPLQTLEEIQQREGSDFDNLMDQEDQETRPDNFSTAMVVTNRNTAMNAAEQHDVDFSEIEPITAALKMLQHIDRLLQQHASFWSQMEVVVDVMMQRANHVESMVNYTRNPRLRSRFMERVDEYAEMWNRVTQMCQNFHRGTQPQRNRKLYQFLTEI